jgi:hypothetical protein
MARATLAEGLAVEGLMRKKREQESDGRRSDRLEKNAQNRSEQASADDNALDEAVRISIRLHGA